MKARRQVLLQHLEAVCGNEYATKVIHLEQLLHLALEAFPNDTAFAQYKDRLKPGKDVLRRIGGVPVHNVLTLISGIDTMAFDVRSLLLTKLSEAATTPAEPPSQP